MSKIQRFEELSVWQESFKLSVELYQIFSSCREYALKDQICKSGVSIPSNIAEGFERNSNKEFVRFLKIAKGSSGELRTQLLIAQQINLVEKNEIEKLILKSIEISKMLQKLITYRESLI